MLLANRIVPESCSERPRRRHIKSSEGMGPGPASVHGTHVCVDVAMPEPSEDSLREETNEEKPPPSG